MHAGKSGVAMEVAIIDQKKAYVCYTEVAAYASMLSLLI